MQSKLLVHTINNCWKQTTLWNRKHWFNKEEAIYCKHHASTFIPKSSLPTSITDPLIESNNQLSSLLTKKIMQEATIQKYLNFIAYYPKIPSRFPCMHRECPNFEEYHLPGRCDTPPLVGWGLLLFLVPVLPQNRIPQHHWPE